MLRTAILALAFASVAGEASAQALTIYEHINFRGRQANLIRAVPDLAAAGWNDRISSIRLRSGRWVFCEHIHYQGRCRVVTGSIRSLVAAGWNDRISSIRPAVRGR